MKNNPFKIFALLTLGTLLSAHTARAQDYPYEEAPPKNSAAAKELPVESPEELEKAGKYQKRTSIFRMALKGGGNYSFTQGGGVTVNGFGVEGRVAFGWDMAFQPIYLETEFGYRGMNLRTTNPVNVILVQQGLYYRERLGKTSMWKPGLLTSFDVRIFNSDSGVGKETALLPSIGLTSLWEFGAVLFQVSGYIHRIGSGSNFLSGAVLGGLKF